MRVSLLSSWQSKSRVRLHQLYPANPAPQPAPCNEIHRFSPQGERRNEPGLTQKDSQEGCAPSAAVPGQQRPGTTRWLRGHRPAPSPARRHGDTQQRLPPPGARREQAGSETGMNLNLKAIYKINPSVSSSKPLFVSHLQIFNASICRCHTKKSIIAETEVVLCIFYPRFYFS